MLQKFWLEKTLNLNLFQKLWCIYNTNYLHINKITIITISVHTFKIQKRKPESKYFAYKVLAMRNNKANYFHLVVQQLQDWPLARCIHVVKKPEKKI